MTGGGVFDGAGDADREGREPSGRFCLLALESCGGGPALDTVDIAVEIALARGMWGMAVTVAATMAVMWSE